MASDADKDAAPLDSLGSARHSFVSAEKVVGNTRNRKRGPRSSSAFLKRMKNLRGDDPPSDMVSGESDTPISEDNIDTQPFCFYNINIKCLLSHLGEIQHHLDVYNPHVVFFQETWLNISIEEVPIPGYRCLSRKDRSETENRGGIIAFVRNDVRNVVHLFNSDDAEELGTYCTPMLAPTPLQIGTDLEPLAMIL